MLCLDSNLVSDYLTGHEPAQEFLDAHPHENLVVTATTMVELYMGHSTVSSMVISTILGKPSAGSAWMCYNTIIERRSKLLACSGNSSIGEHRSRLWTR